MTRNLLLSSLIALTAALGPRVASARSIRQAGNFGIGLGAGTFATGFSMKYFMEKTMAVQGNVGWWRSRYFCTRHICYGGGNSLALSADLLFEQAPIAGNDQVSLAWNVGGGLGLGLDDWANDVGVGAALVVGLEILFEVVPIDIAIEYRPGLYVLPDFEIDPVNFTAHIRYYF